eukprot:3472876-Heterocapsa_arctica.AAC.1
MQRLRELSMKIGLATNRPTSRPQKVLNKADTTLRKRRKVIDNVYLAQRAQEHMSRTYNKCVTN